MTYGIFQYTRKTNSSSRLVTIQKQSNKQYKLQRNGMREKLQEGEAWKI